MVRLGMQRGRGATWLETEVLGEVATVDLVGRWIIWGGCRRGWMRGRIGDGTFAEAIQSFWEETKRWFVSIFYLSRCLESVLAS